MMYPQQKGRDYYDEYVGSCDICWEEIPAGSPYYRLPDGSTVCDDYDCLKEWAEDYLTY